MKLCNVCNISKPSEDFCLRRASPDGLSYSCKPCHSAYAKRHYRGRSKIAKESAKAWAKANPNRRREIWAKSADAHRQKNQAYSREYQREKRLQDPETARALGRRHTSIRRAREAGNGGVVCQDAWDALFNLFEFKTCLYCGADNSDLVMDHFLPVAAGGRTEVGNLLPCCRSCNGRKNAKLPREWLAAPVYEELSRFLAITKEAAASFDGVAT